MPRGAKGRWGDEGMPRGAKGRWGEEGGRRAARPPCRAVRTCLPPFGPRYTTYVHDLASFFIDVHPNGSSPPLPPCCLSGSEGATIAAAAMGGPPAAPTAAGAPGAPGAPEAAAPSSPVAPAVFAFFAWGSIPAAAHLPHVTKGGVVRRACHVSPREVWGLIPAVLRTRSRSAPDPHSPPPRALPSPRPPSPSTPPCTPLTAQDQPVQGWLSRPLPCSRRASTGTRCAARVGRARPRAWPAPSPSPPPPPPWPPPPPPCSPPFGHARPPELPWPEQRPIVGETV